MQMMKFRRRNVNGLQSEVSRNKLLLCQFQENFCCVEVDLVKCHSLVDSQQPSEPAELEVDEQKAEKRGKKGLQR